MAIEEETPQQRLSLMSLLLAVIEKRKWNWLLLIWRGDHRAKSGSAKVSLPVQQSPSGPFGKK